MEALKNELTVLEVRNGKIQVALPKPTKSNNKKTAAKQPEKKEPEKPKENKQEKPKDNKKDNKKDKPKKEGKQKQPSAPPADDKPVDVSRLHMKVGKIVECVKHPGKPIINTFLTKIGSVYFTAIVPYIFIRQIDHSASNERSTLIENFGLIGPDIQEEVVITPV